MERCLISFEKWMEKKFLPLGVWGRIGKKCQVQGPLLYDPYYMMLNSARLSVVHSETSDLILEREIHR